MLYTIKNQFFSLCVDSLGAPMMSIQTVDGCEYLWQGDSAYWEDRAPVLFPFIARLEDKKYRLSGNTYPMGIHGFASSSEFSLIRQTDIELVFALRDTIATRVNYPFVFTFEITYRLVGHTIVVQNKVYNKSAAPMHFALGGHPGFRVPIGNGEKFEDYYLEFSKKCVPDRVGFTSDTILLNGQTKRYNLEEETKLHLKHDLFDDDAIILQNVSRQVTLKNSVSSRCVTVSYPDMSYLGIWHWPNTDAPYVCIEPWTSLPGRSGVLEEISSRSDFVHLASDKCYENVWTITIGE